MACKRRKATAGILAPNIQRGGTAIPLGNNLYWMKGRKHNSGGIDIGKDLEVENNEVMQMLPTETRVFSSVKMLGGNSPAELVANGLNPDAVFAMQEQYKKVNRIKDDGSRYKKGGKYEQWKEEHPILDTVTDFLPIVSTVKDGIELYEKPSWSNAGWLTLDLASDILTAGAGKAIVGSAKGAAKTLKAASKGRKVSQRTKTIINAATPKNVNLGDIMEGGEQVEKFVKKAGLIGTDLYQNHVQHTIQEKEKRVSKKLDKYGGKAKLGKRIKGVEENGSRDIYYDDKQHRWVWGSNRQVLPLGHRVKLDDGYEYQLNSDGSRTRIGKKPNAYERMITSPMQYTPNNDKVEAIGDVLTAPFVDQGETYYNGILPLRNGSQYKDAPLYAYRTGDMSYLKNDDNYIRTIDRSNNPTLPRKLYTFYNQDTLYLPSTLIQNLDRLKQGIGMNQENVNRDYIYGAEYKPIIDARNHHMQVRQLDNRKYVADFSDVFDVNDEFFDSKANPIVFSQYGVPVEFTGDSTKWNDSFVNELNKALSKKYGGKMNLQNSVNNSLTNNKRMISQNKLGTVVRIDCAGRDRLAYIPSTGSSKQDMKCGGRVKGRLGLSSGVQSMLDNILLAKYPNLNKDMSEDEKIDAWDDLLYGNIGDATREDIVLDDGTVWNVNLPETTVIAPVKEKWTPPKINISSPNPYTNRPEVVMGQNPQRDDGLQEKIKGLGDNTNYHWIKAGTDLLTTGLSAFNNLYYLNKMKTPPRPAIDPGVKLKTKWNNNATLSAIRENLASARNDLVRNTASSNTLRNKLGEIGLNALMLTNKSNEEKENKETELINEDRKLKARTIASNVNNYNDWLNKVNLFRNNILDKRSEVWNNTMSNVNKVVNEVIEGQERKDAEQRQYDFLSYAYPLVRNNPEVRQYLYDILFGKYNQNIKVR